MPELTPQERLDKQKTLRDWLRWQLSQSDEAIRRLEQQVEEDRRRRDVARIEMSWKLQPPRADGAQPMLHRGNCGLFKTLTGYLDKAHVVIAFDQFPDLEMCEICAPWGLLGIPKPTPRKPSP